MVNDLGASGFRIELKEYDPDPRPKCKYWRKDGMEVTLHCDEKSKKYYLSRGFLLEPPKSVELPPKYRCPVCKAGMDSLTEMISCLEKHNKEVNNGIS